MPPDTANTARRVFGPEKRAAVVSLFQTEGIEAPNLKILLMMFNVVARVVNSVRGVNVDEFEKFCKNTYLQSLHTFPFCNISDAIHRILGHVCEKMRKLGNTGCGQMSENSLEATHKIIRRLLKWHARPFLNEGFEDCMNHLYFLSSPVQRDCSGKGPHTLKDKPIKSEDDRLVQSFFT